MKSIFHKLTDRLLAKIGLDFDFTIEMRGAPFDQITEELFVGARPQPEGLAALKDAGVTHIVSCLPQVECEKMAFLREEFHTLTLALHDSVEQDIAAAFPTFFDFIAEAQKSNPKPKLLVHCEVGVSRSATMAIAHVMRSEQKSFLEAFWQVRAQRPGVLPNVGFASQLQRFEREVLSAQPAQEELSSLSRYLHQICNAPVEPDVLEAALRRHDYDAMQAIRAIFGDDVPRVIQGVRL